MGEKFKRLISRAYHTPDSGWQAGERYRTRFCVNKKSFMLQKMGAENFLGFV
jgi:hypothetical protein